MTTIMTKVYAIRFRMSHWFEMCFSLFRNYAFIIYSHKYEHEKSCRSA